MSNLNPMRDEVIRILIDLANAYEDGKDTGDNALAWLLFEVVEQTGFAPWLLALRDVATEMSSVAFSEDDEARAAALDQLAKALDVSVEVFADQKGVQAEEKPPPRKKETRAASPKKSKK
jgi:hypothetical protein